MIKKSNITQENKKEHQNYDLSLPVKKCSFTLVSDLQLVLSTLSRDVVLSTQGKSIITLVHFAIKIVIDGSSQHRCHITQLRMLHLFHRS